MNYKKETKIVGLLLCLLALPAITFASSVRHMNLDALTDRAALIFRGTVTGIESGTVHIGGADLPTTTYAFRISELFKGEATVTKEGEQFVTVTMIGSMKKSDEINPNLTRFDRFHEVPRLQHNQELLLFTTPESQFGLSVTVGLAQGCFDIAGGMALSRADNAGLFMDTTYMGPASGPINYNELASRIRATLARR